MNYHDTHDEIFEPNHIYIDNRVQENNYDSEASTSSFASTNSTGSQASNAQASSSQVKPDKWLLLEKFAHLDLADDFVKASATRDSTKPVCIFFNKLETAHHKMLTQTSECRSLDCKGSQCSFQYKFQRCIIYMQTNSDFGY